jgi:gamma-glutamyl-gamma-aminobutyrate hydrolase PuuD
MYRVAAATSHFFESFKRYIPQLEIVDTRKIAEYNLIIFTGGEDISPSLYNRSNVHSYGVNEKRDSLEHGIYTVAKGLRGVRMFGVCRGHQLLLALGGCALVQDIGLEHTDIHDSPHVLEFNKRIGFSEPLKAVFPKVTNSLHHQGVTTDTINATGNATVLASYKGISEACSRNDNIFTTQFHPEFMQGQQDFFDWLITDYIKYGIRKFCYTIEEGQEEGVHSLPEEWAAPLRMPLTFTRTVRSSSPDNVVESTQSMSTPRISEEEVGVGQSRLQNIISWDTSWDDFTTNLNTTEQT